MLPSSLIARSHPGPHFCANWPLGRLGIGRTKRWPGNVVVGVTVGDALWFATPAVNLSLHHGQWPVHLKPSSLRSLTAHYGIIALPISLGQVNLLPVSHLHIHLKMSATNIIFTYSNTICKNHDMY